MRPLAGDKWEPTPSMIKKFLAKLVSSFERPNKSWEREKVDAEMAEERRRQIRANQGVPQPGQFSERTTPREEEILGPSDSALKEEGK